MYLIYYLHYKIYSSSFCFKLLIIYISFPKHISYLINIEFEKYDNKTWNNKKWFVGTEKYHHSCTNLTTVCKKLRLCYRVVISRISYYCSQYIGVFYVPVNNLKYILASKNKEN